MSTLTYDILIVDDPDDKVQPGLLTLSVDNAGWCTDCHPKPPAWQSSEHPLQACGGWWMGSLPPAYGPGSTLFCSNGPCLPSHALPQRHKHLSGYNMPPPLGGANCYQQIAQFNYTLLFYKLILLFFSIGALTYQIKLFKSPSNWIKSAKPIKITLII